MMMSTRIASSLQTPIKTNSVNTVRTSACSYRFSNSAVRHSSHAVHRFLTLVWLIIYYSSDQSLATLLYFLGSKWHVKIRCPDCKEAAELADDFSFVKCPNCSFDMTYGEYVKYIAYKDARYRDILSDYK